MHSTEIFDGNKNSIEMEHPQSKSSEVYEKSLKSESPINEANNPGSRDTSSETIDVITVPVTAENNGNINLPTNGTNGTNGNNNTVVPAAQTTEAIPILPPVLPPAPTPSFTREVLPPNSIYGIESLTSRPYEPTDMKFLPEGIHSPRYPTHTMQSPHHSSPDKDPARHVLRPDGSTSWVSPVKSHNYRAQIPPTSPYVDPRDPNNFSGGPRRYVPPFYGNGRNFIHPNDRSRYGAYPLGSPLMSTLGYPREQLDPSRYQLHMAQSMGFEEDKFKLSPPSMDDKHIWTKQEVELLLDLYEEHKSKLQDPRVRKTKVWDDIAKQIHDKLEADVNGCQCNQKFRNMKADYQKVVEHNARSGSFRKTCKYYDRLEKLLTPVSEPDKLKDEMDSDGKYFNGVAGFNGANGQNGFGKMGFYERDMSSRTSSSPESGENIRTFENGTGSSNTPSSPEKRPLNQLETASDDSSPPPSKRPCTECSCGGVDKRELIEVLKEFLREQRKREEETIQRIQALHKEKIDTVVKFLDLFQELVKKV